MKITLNHREINEALVAYVNYLGFAPTGTIDINLTVGRGANGNSAVVQIEGTEDTKESKPTTKKQASVATEEKEITDKTPMFGEE